LTLPAHETSIVRDVIEVGVTVAVASIGLAVIGYFRRRMREDAASEADLLAEFQAAYDAGEMDAEEYDRVRETMRRRGEQPSSGKRPAIAGAKPPDRLTDGEPSATNVESHLATDSDGENATAPGADRA
jgi:hypothetical protein